MYVLISLYLLQYLLNIFNDERQQPEKRIVSVSACVTSSCCVSDESSFIAVLDNNLH